ncbi:MAG: hypothetical protein MRK02_09855 [Candidatus Scalindua sp.]|nr:hypothetical protein [Candidatus Scalindua sp.]
MTNIQQKHKLFKPLVIGAPRTGFTLLCSILIHFVPLAPSKWDLRQRILNALLRELGDHISSEIVRGFASKGIKENLLYNPGFKTMLGGPKWLSKHRDGFACFRKYIGVRGVGDFTLITSHPKEVLDCHEIVHSHIDPGIWTSHPDYADYTRFASVRNPIGTLNSSVFSINALASEYLQRFLPEKEYHDDIRQHLALYKFTDMKFFEGLIKFLAGTLKEFVEYRDKFIIMKWEDLILNPGPTILDLARAAEIEIQESYAAEIWERIGHRNLTGAHHHNLRKGMGKVGSWKKSIVNEHLDAIKNGGLEPYMVELGYGPVTYLNEKDYTPYQQKIKRYLDKGEIFNDYPDQDLFTFAFNKSNLVSDKFPFRCNNWREWTQVERSIFKDEILEQKIWDIAEDATGRINALIQDFLGADYASKDEALKSLKNLYGKHKADLGRIDARRYEAAFTAARETVSQTGQKSFVGLTRKFMKRCKMFLLHGVKEETV